ncbi:hypothetical protein ACOI1C_19160 [Bacillus sp. DJP31]|uniref:hypothetical protein n=1 Tax=Bacillus sp. DJP31 TaxID=3409789 RepID=UPI003BB6C220
MELSNLNIHGDPLYFLVKSQSLSLTFFIFFMFVSYEYFSKLKSVNLEEVIGSYYIGKAKAYLYQFLFFLLPIFLVFLSVTLFDIYVYFKEQVNFDIYFLHIVKNNLLNILLVSLIATLIGFTIALVLRRFPAFTLMALIIFFVSPLVEFILFPLRYININSYPFTDFFAITPPNLNWQEDNLYGISIESYRWNIALFWLFLLFMFLINSIISKRNYVARLLSLCALSITILNLILFLNPGSTVIKDYRPDGLVSHDIKYYSEAEQKEEPAMFSIESYKLKVDIKKALSATAEIKLRTDKILDSYKFTLYRGYEVSKVYNDLDEELDFIQKGDYLEILNPNKKNVVDLVIVYQGFSPIFYSNHQGVFLPAYFPYYPKGGYNKVYDINTHGFITNKTNSLADFEVTVNSNVPVFSNFDEFEKNIFRGKSEGVTLIGGFVQERDISSFKVYDFLLDPSDISWLPELEKDFREYIDKYNKQDGSKEGIKLIATPPINIHSESEKFVKYSDHIILEDFYSPSWILERMRMNEQ